MAKLHDYTVLMCGHCCFVNELFPKSCCRAAVRRWRMLPCLHFFLLIVISSLIKFTPIQINPVSVAFWVIFYYHQKNSIAVALLLPMQPKEADACLIGCLKSFKHERRGAAKQCVKWINHGSEKSVVGTLNLFLCYPHLCRCSMFLLTCASAPLCWNSLCQFGPCRRCWLRADKTARG